MKRFIFVSSASRYMLSDKRTKKELRAFVKENVDRRNGHHATYVIVDEPLL